MSNRKQIVKPPFAFVEVNNLIEIKQPRKLPANITKLAAGAPTSSTSYAMIRSNRSYPLQMMQMREEIKQIREVLSKLQETAFSREEDDSMYDQKEIIEKIDQVKDKVSNIETTIAIVEERTKKLETIEQALSELNGKIPGDVASKDFVGKEINGVKNWVYATFAAAIVAVLPTIIGFFK